MYGFHTEKDKRTAECHIYVTEFT